jgi:hypothetical protein
MYNVGSEVLVAVRRWDVTLCSLVEVHRRFGGT